MKRMSPRFVANTLIDLLLLLVGIAHIPSVLNRSMAPFEVARDGDEVLITRILDANACNGLQPGDRLLAWNSEHMTDPEAVEFLGDLGEVGGKVNVSIDRLDKTQTIEVTLTPFYSSPRFLIVSFIVGFIIWVVGVFILWSVAQGEAALALHWSMIAFAVTIFMTLGSVRPGSVMSVIDRFLFFLSYMGVVAVFFYFTLLYPTPVQRWKPIAVLLACVPGTTLVAGLSYFHLSDLWRGSLEHFSTFQDLFDLFHISLFLYMGAAVVKMAVSLKLASSAEKRKRLQWIVWGLGLGTIPFLFFHILPQLLFSRYLMPEEFATVFFLAIPFSFAVSFLKYRFLDIELLINRSIVYFLLTGFSVLALALVFVLVTSALGIPLSFRQYMLMVGATLALALLFVEVRERLQRAVDDTLFAARSRFRSAVRSIATRLHQSLTIGMLYEAVVEELHRLIPARSIAVFSLEHQVFRPRAYRGDAVTGEISARSVVDDFERVPLVVAGSADRKLSPGEQSVDGWLREHGWTAGCAMLSEQGRLLGVVVLASRTTDRLREEELDLLGTVTSQASEVAGRLLLQERAIIEQEERKRLQDLSDLKSYFVSSVSHELRMPLTSIRLFAETLKNGKALSKKRRREYFEIIEGESVRLTRLIDTVLDFSRIERGTKRYTRTRTNVAAIGKKALLAMRYELEKNKAVVTVRIAKRLPELLVDADALEEALMNLLSNALKYSPGNKVVGLTMSKSAGAVVIDVSDKGIGIDASDRSRIFGRFYRGTHPHVRHVGGMGLGLSVVQHFVEAHGGSIDVTGTQGKGSMFSLRLPVDSSTRE